MKLVSLCACLCICPSLWFQTSHPCSKRALVPLSLNVAGVGNLRPNDLVPVSGKLAQQKVYEGIRALCTKPAVAVPDLEHFLPASLFTETGTLLKQLQNLAKHLAKY